MATPKVLLFYGFAPLADPDAIRLWQRTLCESLGIRGRIIVSKDGINATLGGDVVQLKKYIKGTRAYAPFKDIDFKWSEGRAQPDGTSADFPRLSVRVREELVTFGAPDELEVDENGVVDGGTHLSPADLHALVESKDVVFFDGRNKIESDIGHFAGAVRPEVETTREFIEVLDSGVYDHLKDKPVVTYCTGGIRCEVLTPLMKKRGFREVYQLDGGIATYGEAYGDDGLWQGSLYVFDDRISMDFSDHAALVGACDLCGQATNDVADCGDVSCVRQMVRCASCLGGHTMCDQHALTA
ncbi:oxygen-dependent tRNA uridine(34) hydroxylase TrhO [Aeromicrobium wangtongii]|uniref:tRNA uridine(34) hydroxylase n=1 Tax=Aeromicrobium wangtongii TaxID=2969247 RepID=A0ABY5M6S5_9ACTN|nr:rhodanese-related sulfurtransferase [Aeromicrobium wangtongii]MCD9199905.1 rhodanese-related sulfurtransferase [Aeromicrobium wangtongii]UUP13522.1 rhodanese-related sulfurtransferase [Aeromicrobium wangtongii]